MKKAKNKLKDVSWTTEELLEWTQRGLIPKELLTPKEYNGLTTYIMENKEKLLSYYKTNNENFDWQITLPPPHELSTAYELQVVEKKTGKVIETLHQVKRLVLCEGMSLDIRAQEFEDWEKETAGMRDLTQQEKTDLKETILKIAPKGTLSKQEIVTVIKEIRKKRGTCKVRRGGHFVDSKLQNIPQGPSIFDALSPKTRDKIEESKVIVKTLGIKLTPQEDKLISAIYNLLHDKSENRDIDSELFYAGNLPSSPVPYGNTTSISAKLRVKPAELYKEYLGKDTFSGKEIYNIKTILIGLSEKKFIIQYDRQRKVKRGNKIEVLTDRIEDMQSIIKVISYIEGMTDKEIKSLDTGNHMIREQKEELIVALNPLLTDQINSKYVEYPSDINKRTMIASGGARKVTESIIALRDYMLREISAKRYKCSLNEDTLINLLLLNSYLKSGKKKRVAERIKESIEASKKLGLIIEEVEIKGARGQTKYTFTLNPEFE